ncbi:hypothetical protein MKMG_01709 [Methanogenium sp. MK-MG]|nr:hypothetical protein MKMG_01709 [Methanogenium sp. MK-MG]
MFRSVDIRLYATGAAGVFMQKDGSLWPPIPVISEKYGRNGRRFVHSRMPSKYGCSVRYFSCCLIIAEYYGGVVVRVFERMYGVSPGVMGPLRASVGMGFLGDARLFGRRFALDLYAI